MPAIKKIPTLSSASDSATSTNILLRLAFEHSRQAIIISAIGTKQIILANNAASKLLGYSKKVLQSKSCLSIFDMTEAAFKKILKQRRAGDGTNHYATISKKNGSRIFCEINSVIFSEAGKEMAVTTLTDMSERTLRQKNIDTKNEKTVADNISIARSLQRDIDVENEKTVADNISIANSRQRSIDLQNEKTVARDINIAKSLQKVIDVQNEKTVADDISIAKSKQKDIDIKNKKLVADNINLALLKQKGIDIKNEKRVAYNIVLAISKQKNIDIKNKKLAADNIVRALSKQTNLDIKNEKIKVRELFEARKDARDTERSDIGKELHDNVNQLLGASKMYLELGKRGGKDSQMYLARSSEYTLTAIEEIRKLTKGLITDVIKNLGLRQAIENISHDMMEMSPLKISCDLDHFTEQSVTNKFKLNAFRVVQEQLNNILKHAKATEVRINLFQDKNSTSLTISDNGVGFDLAKKQTGIGIENIKSRAQVYNGAARFFSEPGQGCVLALTFPQSGYAV